MLGTVFCRELGRVVLDQMSQSVFVVGELVRTFSGFVDEIVAEILRDFDRGEGVREV